MTIRWKIYYRFILEWIAGKNPGYDHQLRILTIRLFPRSRPENFADAFTKITFAIHDAARQMTQMMIPMITAQKTMVEFARAFSSDDLQFTKDNCRVCRGTGLIGTSVEDEQSELMTPCPHCSNLKLNLKGLS